MKVKSKYAIWIVVVLVAMILGCVLLLGEKCVSECVPHSEPLQESDRQMSLAASSGKDLEYWIDGERGTAGCHWHLTHIKCERGGCLYRCSETEAIWRLSRQKNSSLKMEKCGDSTLQQTYIFSSPSVDGN